jgi:hypothetical protein
MHGLRPFQDQSTAKTKCPQGEPKAHAISCLEGSFLTPGRPKADPLTYPSPLLPIPISLRVRVSEPLLLLPLQAYSAVAIHFKASVDELVSLAKARSRPRRNSLFRT